MYWYVLDRGGRYMFGSLDEDVGRTEYVYIIRLKLYKTRPVTQFFLVNSLYKEEFAVKEFINDLKSPVYGVINAHILDYNFEFVEETTLDGIKCNMYKSKCGDEMYVRKQNIFSDGTYYLGGSI
jgi:hypothetical protein